MLYVVYMQDGSTFKPVAVKSTFGEALQEARVRQGRYFISERTPESVQAEFLSK